MNLQEIYAVLWNKYISIDKRTPHFLAQINWLGDLFEISENVRLDLKNRIGSAYYKSAVISYVGKRRLLANDKMSLTSLAEHLQLDTAIASQILNEQQQVVINNFTEVLIKKNRCSMEDHRETERILESFQITATLRNDIYQQLKSPALYWQVENSALKIYTVAPSILQKNEFCYYYADHVKWYETRNSGYRTSALELINTGELYLTNKRLLFVGNLKNSQVPLDRILKVVKGINGVTIHKDKGKDPTLALSTDLELFSIIINRLRKGQY